MKRYRSIASLSYVEKLFHDHGGVYCYSHRDYDDISEDPDCIEVEFDKTNITLYIIPYTMTAEGCAFLTNILEYIKEER